MVEATDVLVFGEGEVTIFVVVDGGDSFAVWVDDYIKIKEFCVSGWFEAEIVGRLVMLV